MLNDTAPRKDTIRVLVADGSRIHTYLLADALSRDPSLEAIPFDSDPRSLVTAVMGLDIDVLLISTDQGEEPCRGLELLREVRAARPGIRAVVLLDSLNDDTVLNALRAGARGIFGNGQPVVVLIKCIRSVHQGQVWANSQQLTIAVEALASAPTVRAMNSRGMRLLTNRELQVVRCLAEGMTNREIATRLKLSQHTIKNYLFRIYDKLGVSSRVELLFMTLSQDSSEQALLPPASKEGLEGHRYSQYESDPYKKSAAAGLPATPLEPAQLYLSRSNNPQELVDAYMWHLVASERAMQAQESFTKVMTPQQIEEAREKASIWLSNWRQTEVPSAQPFSRLPRKMA